MVLSGGGAKGLAHIGVLKALEENDIPIDYITGSSMGAVIGGLYASGYSPEEIEALALSPEFSSWTSEPTSMGTVFFFKSYDPDASWVNLHFDYDDVTKKLESRLPTNLISPNMMDFAIMELFSSASAVSGYNFDSLFVPFRCVASDIDSAKSVILKSGQLGSAIRASLTYPFYFKPIELNGKLLFDGGMYNNFPADVAVNEFDPQIIIGSKTTWNPPNPQEDDIVSQIKNMITQETKFVIPDNKGIMIESNVADMNVVDFSRSREMIDSGYAAAMRMMPDIKERISRRVTPAVLMEKRQAFNSKKPATIIDSINVTGLNKSQASYVQHLFKERASYLTLRTFKKDYFKLLSDKKIKYVYPTMTYFQKRSFYELNLRVTQAEHFNAEFGGNISSNAASTAFLGLQYNLLSRIGIGVIANGYFGRFYSSANLELRLDFPGRLPIYFKADFTYNHMDYFRNATYFFEDKDPSFLISNESHFNVQGGIPASFHSIVSMNAAVGYTKDEYYQTNQFTRYDTADVTFFNFFTPGFTYQYNTLNYKQFADKGTGLQVDFRFIYGREHTIPGSTSVEDGQDTILYHNWLHLRAMYNKYFVFNKWFRMGIYGEVLLSNQDFFSNYTATILRTPAFEPIPEMKILFMPNYRAFNYFGFGMQPIATLFKNFDVRAEGYIFQPYEAIKQGSDQQAVKGPKWSGTAFVVSGSLIYYLRFTPVSLSFNYYSQGADRFSIMFNIGFIIFNSSVLD